MDDETSGHMKPLPPSWVGVDPPWLVIAPPGNPAIRIDLRVLDRIEVCPQGKPDDDDEFESREWPEHDQACDVRLTCGDLEVGLYVADGPEAALEIVRHAAPLTRAVARGDAPTDLEKFVLVGDDAVCCRGDKLTVGAIAFAIGEVREYALRGANVPVGGSCVLQAAVALLVIAATEREAEKNATATEQA
jgi:hypothetical protein